MKALKTNAKSVRMTDEIRAYVENMDGDGFNQKFENMVLYAMKTEEDRRRELQLLEEQIARKREILLHLEKIDYMLVTMERQIHGACVSVGRLFEETGSVSEDVTSFDMETPFRE